MGVLHKLRKNIKKAIWGSAIIIAISASVGCSNNNGTLQSSEQPKQEITQVEDDKTLAINDDYITYSAVASNYFTSETYSRAYMPNNVLDDDSFSSWVLNDNKQGKGEYITINFDKTIEVKKLYILNGLGDKDYEDGYYNDNRVKTLNAEFSNGESETIILDDGTLEEQEITLSKPVNTEYVKLTIDDIYEGNKNKNLTCIGSIGINYRRIQDNSPSNDETTNFIGIYGDYKIDKDKEFSIITKYIDYREGLDNKTKVQILADEMLKQFKEEDSENFENNFGDDAKITISKGQNDKYIIADLRGNTLERIFDGTFSVIKTYSLESNLIQLYYEGDDWINKIEFTKNGQPLSLSENEEDQSKHIIDKQYVKSEEESYRSFMEEDNTTYGASNQNLQVSAYTIPCDFMPSDVDMQVHQSIDIEERNVPNVKYTEKEALDLLLKKINPMNKEWTINSDNNYKLTRVHYIDHDVPQNYDIVGYKIDAWVGDVIQSTHYFIDAYTGNIYWIYNDKIQLLQK